MKLTIVVDDDDRDQAPDVAWTATLYGTDGEMLTSGAGLGATPRQAVTDLLCTWEREDH